MWSVNAPLIDTSIIAVLLGDPLGDSRSLWLLRKRHMAEPPVLWEVGVNCSTLLNARKPLLAPRATIICGLTLGVLSWTTAKYMVRTGGLTREAPGGSQFKCAFKG